MTRLLLTIFTVLGFIAACASDPDAGPPEDPDDPSPVLTRLELTAPAVRLDPGASMKLDVAAFDQDGAPMTVPALTWTSSVTAVARVTPEGLVTGLAPGRTTIIAQRGAVSGTFALQVRELAASVARVVIEPSGELVLARGATTMLQATAYDADDNALPGRAMTWISNDTAIVTVGDGGELTAVSAGTATVYVSCEGATGSAAIRVVVPVARVAFDVGPVIAMRPTQTRTLTVTAYDDHDEVLADRTVQLSSSASSIASIAADGTLTAHAHGNAIITADVEGVQTQLEIHVRQVARIVLNYDEATIDVNESLAMTATLYDRDDQPIQDAVTWSSDRPQYAEVHPNGTVFGVAEGGAIITASVGDVSATATIFVARWTERTLKSVNGAALPAQLYKFEWTTSDGVDHEMEMQATDGFLATRALDGRYEMTVFGPVYTDGTLSGHHQHTSAGEMKFDAQTQRWTFTPDNVFQGGPFTGRYVGTDRLEVTYQADPHAPAATLVFALD